jgi:hypothetical protein
MGGKSLIDLVLGTCVQNKDFLSDGLGSRLQLFYLEGGGSTVWVNEKCDQSGARHKFAEESETLRPEPNGKDAYACQISAWSVEAGDKTRLDRIAAIRKHHGDSCGCCLCRQCRRPVGGDKHGHLPTNQIGCERRKPIVLTVRKTEFDCNVLSDGVVRFFQSLAECNQ